MSLNAASHQWAADTARLAVGSSAAAVDWQGSSGGWLHDCSVSAKLRKKTRRMAEACKRLIKNFAFCWSCLYPSKKFAEIDDPVKREEFLNAVPHESAAAWEHVNLFGEYDLLEGKFEDSVGIKQPKLTN